MACCWRLKLPQTVDLEIVETAPGIKGASASARNKPATLTTGLVVQVPEYLSLARRSASISKKNAIWVVLTDCGVCRVALRLPGLQTAKKPAQAGFCRPGKRSAPGNRITAAPDTSSSSAPAQRRALPPSLSVGQSPNTGLVFLRRSSSI
jgi:hypothetical protein